ncbi:MAG: hypothetical protein ACXWWU_06375 [Candidatus Limnocylindria bacterium]
MLAGTRVAMGVALLLATLIGCTTQTPTPSPGPTARTSTQPTPPPTPTIGPTGETGFPSSVLGLDVHSVAGIYQLAADRRLDGRLAAVGGYWAQFALPCPFMPHQPVILGFCSGGSFADTPEAARSQGGSVNGLAPIAVRETANGDFLWSLGSSGDVGLMGVGAVVLIVHATDSRAWQCAPDDRASCHSRLVIDSVAWVNGDAMALNPDMSALPGVALPLADVIAAGVKPGEQLVTAYPLLAGDLNDVDPRLIDQASDSVWFVRVLTTTPDSDAIADGVVRLVSDSASAIVAEMPLVVADDYAPARVILDAKDWNGNGAYPRFTVGAGTTVVAEGALGSSSTPLTVPAGDYVVHAFIATPEANPVAGPTCDLSLSVEAEADVAYYADFAGSGDCSWTAGTLFP